MLIRLLLGAVVVVTTVGCGDDGGDAGNDDPAEELADRVSAILEADSSAVVARLAESDAGLDADDLAHADVLCPAVDDPDPGDLATCRVTAAGTELELDVEFQPDGAIEVVALVPAP